MLPSIPPDAIEAEQAHRAARQIMQGSTRLTREQRRRKAISYVVRQFDIPFPSAKELIRIVESE